MRELIGALVRLTSYASDHARMSAGAALTQVQGAFGGGVRYLDGGWQVLVDGLGRPRRALGRPCSRVRGPPRSRPAAIPASCASLTARRSRPTPCSSRPARHRRRAARRRPRAAARGWADAATARARRLLSTSGSRALPRPRATFALGVDRPLYLSVHSASADLAPAGGAMIHVLKHLPTGGGEAKADERELEGLLDLIQPGWREAVVEHRFLPSMMVTNDLPTAAHGGLRGRPGRRRPARRGRLRRRRLGGAEAMLADASLASARRAAEAIVARPLRARAAA